MAKQRIQSQAKKWLKKWGIEKLPYDEFNKARIHNSVYYENWKENERLAHLGDAVIYILDSDKNYRSEERYSKGKMDLKRRGHIEKSFLAKVFDYLEFEKILIINNVKKPYGVRLRAEMVESLFGALYISCGYKYCQDLWFKILKSEDEINQL